MDIYVAKKLKIQTFKLLSTQKGKSLMLILYQQGYLNAQKSD